MIRKVDINAYSLHPPIVRRFFGGWGTQLARARAASVGREKAMQVFKRPRSRRSISLQPRREPEELW
ncbi:MAG TPA: hypothetical protein VGQ35_17225 [Dongiaceae bacterium]|jgi:hypothetical protein|nr:hypothetical protein [Dongiaceae bacterium]